MPRSSCRLAILLVVAAIVGHASAAFWDDSLPAYSLLNTMVDSTDGCAEIVHVTNLGADGPGLGWDEINAAGPYDEPVIDAPCATPVFTREPHRILDTPPFPLTSTLYTAHEAREHCLTHAGAWPANRDETDARVLREVRAKTRSAVGDSVDSDEPVQTKRNTPPAIPHDPGDGVVFDGNHPLLHVERSGLTRLENWLIARHLDAGGCQETVYDAPEWLTRNNAGPEGD